MLKSAHKVEVASRNLIYRSQFIEALEHGDYLLADNNCENVIENLNFCDDRKILTNKQH